MPNDRIIHGDCLTELAKLPEKSVHCCVTSPPYWGLRDYKIQPVSWPEVTFSPMPGLPPMTIPEQDAVHGLEPDLWAYVAHEVAVFREVRRVLWDDGTLWVNMGDCYASQGGPIKDGGGINDILGGKKETQDYNRSRTAPSGLKPKDLVGIPWRVAFALQADGWWLRSDIIWSKPNPMPESVTDRPTKAHEYLFLLAKAERYFYDAEAVKEDAVPQKRTGIPIGYATPKHVALAAQSGVGGPRSTLNGPSGSSRNKRTVWTVATSPYSEAHFATFPPNLIKPCILAGTSARGCCPKCGAQWERIVERTPARSKHCPKTTEAHHARGGVGEPVGTVGKSGSGRIDGYTETVGWFPSCRCNNDDDDYEVDPIPCTVLDPFLGSGTTAQVALELGRSAIGIELNPEYLNLADDRTNVTPGLNLA